MNNAHYYYSLGFFFADGSLYKPTYRISIEGLYDDLYPMIPIFNSIIEWLTYDRIRTRNGNITRKSLTLYKGNKTLFEKLYEQGYYQPFCGLKPLSYVPKKYKHLWYRGFFDGDGCVYFNKECNQMCMSGKFDMNWDFITNVFPKFRTQRVSHKNSYSRCRLTNKTDIKSFFEYIYPKGYDFGLKRKYDIFQSIIN